MSALRHIARAPRAASVRARAYHFTAALRAPYKDTESRETLDPRRAEGTQSGRDDDVAANSDAAFNPQKTSPESASQAASTSSSPSDRGTAGGNPLQASGANQELSKPQGDENAPKPADGAGKETSKGGASGGGNTKKTGSPPESSL